STGIGTSGKRLGMTMGIMPKTAYFARIRSTRASGGMAGKGRPANSMWSMAALMSFPVSVSVEIPVFTSGETCWWVSMPSMSTAGDPFTTAVMITRTIATAGPICGSSRSSVLSVDLLPRENVSWKPLGASVLCVTSTDCRASITSCGTGSGTTGPIIRLRWTFLSIRRPRHAFGKRDADARARRLGQLLGTQDAVRVAEPPELLGIAQELRGQGVGPFALHDHVLLEHVEALGL